MKGRIFFASSVAASLLTIAGSVPTARAEDEKESKPATQVQVPAPSAPPPKVTPQTQVKGPAPPVVTPQVTLPTETGSNPNLQQQALDEKAKAAAQGAIKTRVHPVSATINFLTDPVHRPDLSPVRYFCESGEGSHGVIVRLRYEWRPTTSAQYLPQGLLVVRRAKGEERVPVVLRAGSGEARTDVRADADGRLMLPFGLSTADVCPSGCAQVRLVSPTAANADRFDTTWQHACIRWRSTPDLGGG